MERHKQKCEMTEMASLCRNSEGTDFVENGALRLEIKPDILGPNGGET